jgi:5-formyltetrahydrofolate cyclo-ligase
MDKKSIREKCFQVRNELSSEWRLGADCSIARRLFESAVFQRCKTIFCYVSRPDEIDTHTIIEGALSQGKTVAVPRTIGSEHQMEFIKICGLHELKPGKLNILEPPENIELVQQGDTQTLCLIPALCTDKSGYRVGYGGGYYDRFLSNFPGESAVLVYSFLSQEDFPVESYDIPAGWIITETEIKNYPLK